MINRFLVSGIFGMLLSLSTHADTLCQLRNASYAVRQRNPLPLVRISRTTRCPGKYRRVGSIPNEGAIKSYAVEAVMSDKTALQGPQGAQGPQGPQGVQGPIGPQGPTGLPPLPSPLLFTLASSGNGIGACRSEEMETLCGDGDGCVVKFFIESPTHEISIHQATLYLKGDSAGIHASILDPTYSPAQSTHLIGTSEARKLWIPSIGAGMNNFLNSFCPESGGSNTGGFVGSERWRLNFYAVDGYKVTVGIYDN